MAHLFRLDDLKAEALDFFEQSLTVEGAAREFFSSMAAKYPEIQEVVVRYVAEHWAQVKLTGRTSSVQHLSRTGPWT